MKKLIVFVALLGISGCLKTRSEVSEQDEQKQVQHQITEIRQSKADQELRSQSFENELRSLYGKIEVLERRLNESQQNNGMQERELAKQTKDLVDQMKIFEESLANLSGRVERLEKAPKAEAETKPSTDKKKSAWDRAEELFLKKDWKNAALNYQEYNEQNPKGANVSMATYKIGVCFQELKMKSEAKNFFDETIKSFPNSPAARKAKYRLNQLK